MLGTEFADHIVITATAIYGAGLNVRYSDSRGDRGRRPRGRRPVLRPVDRLRRRLPRDRRPRQRHDQRHRRRHRRHRRQGARGPRAARSTTSSARATRATTGCSSTASTYNVATPTAGIVIITETDGSDDRARGRPTALRIDRYDVRLATAPTGPVYVTVSAGRSSQQESRRRHGLAVHRHQRRRLRRPVGVQALRLRQQQLRRPGSPSARSCSPSTPATGTSTSASTCSRSTTRARRATRVVVINHSVISTDARFDGTLVRNVEVTVRDNDTPGVEVEQVQPGTSIDDDRTVVIEGNTTTGAARRAARPAGRGARRRHRDAVHLVLDAAQRPGDLDLLRGRPLRRDHAHDEVHRRRLGRSRSGWSSRRATTPCARTRAPP